MTTVSPNFLTLDLSRFVIVLFSELPSTFISSIFHYLSRTIPSTGVLNSHSLSLFLGFLIVCKRTLNFLIF